MDRSHRVYSLFLTLLLCHHVSSQTKIDVLWVTDDANVVAEKAVKGAWKYLAENEGITISNQYKVTNKLSDPYSNVDNFEICSVIDKAMSSKKPPHIVIDTTLQGTSSEIVKSLTRALALPTMSMSYGLKGDLREWRGITDDEKKYLVQVMPPGDVMPQALRLLIDGQNFTNAAILYDDGFVMEHQYKSLLLNVPCRHIMNRIEKDDAALKKQMMKIRDVDLWNYFVIGSIKNIDRVMSVAQDLKMYGIRYTWWGMTKELSDDVKCSSCENTTMVFMNPSSKNAGRINELKAYGVDSTPKIDSAFYFDMTVRALKAVKGLAGGGAYKADYKWVGCSDYDEANKPTRAGFNLWGALKSASHTASYAEIAWNGNGMSYPMYNMLIHNVKFMGKKKVSQKEVGEYHTGFMGKIAMKSGETLKAFTPVTVYRAVTVIQPPFVMKRTLTDGKTQYYGYCIDLIDEIAKLNNFEYIMFEAPDGKAGQMNAKGEWNGMIKSLMDKKADIAVAPLSVMAERENVIDFTVPYYDLVGISILMKKPKAKTSLFKFLTVLETDVWFCILAAYFFTSVLLWCFDKYSPYSYQNNMEYYKNDEEKRLFTLKECMWFCMTSLTPQGGGEAPKNLSGRLVSATWWLFGFIIIASYTANLAAFLTVSRLETSVQSLDDLSKQYKIRYAPVQDSATSTYFIRMAYIEEKFYEIWKDLSMDDKMNEVERAKLAVWDYPVSDKYTKMWQTMKEAGLPKNYEEALARVKASPSNQEGFAYIGDATDVRYQELISCELQMVGDEFSRKPYALAVQEGSPLKDQVNDAILKLLNQRKLETLKERWWNQNPLRKRCDDDNDESDGISIYNIGGVFIVIFVGIIMAVCTLIFEYWYFKYKKAPRVTDSAKVLAVREFGNEKNGKEKSNFNTEYSNKDGELSPVGNPW